MAQPQIHSETSLPSIWEERLHYWEATLTRDPDSPVAWRWRIQIKILRFLLSRYGSFESAPSPPEESPTITVFNVPSHPSPPKSDLTLRRSLFRVAKSNSFKPPERRESVAPPVISPAPIEPQAYENPLVTAILKTRPLTLVEIFFLTDIESWTHNPQLPRWMRMLSFMLQQFPVVFLVFWALILAICLFRIYCG